MKKVFQWIIFSAFAVAMLSCGSNSDYIDATYTFNGEVHGKTYKMQLTLTKDGDAHLKMLDSPIMEDLSDRRWLPKLYNEGVYGIYEYDEDAECFVAYTSEDRGIENVWYDMNTLNFVKDIYIGNDGYLYFTMEKFSTETYAYETISYERGPKYIKH